MRLTRKDILLKIKYKNKGNLKLKNAIDQLIEAIETKQWKTKDEIKRDRPDADEVHNDGFYFFNLGIHRTLILIEMSDREATVVWAGPHDEYERKFKNSKKVINKYLRDNGWIN